MRTKQKKDSLQQFGDAVNARLSEYFDGHAVVGFKAGTQEPVIIYPSGQDGKTIIALNSLLVAAVRECPRQTHLKKNSK